MGFWKEIDKLINTHEIVIDRPKGSRHPRFPDMIYPFDYGHLEGTSGGDGNEIDVCQGSLPNNELIAVICTVDNKKADAEVKLLVGCTEDEIAIVDRFFNSNYYVAAIVVRRASGAP